LGYFGGAHFGLQRAGVYEAEFDYVVVSNVDLQLASSFLSELEAVAVADDVGLIAPSIFSRHRKRDLNPKILHRLSPSRVRFYEFVFSHRGTYLAYHIASVGADLVRRLGPSRSSSTGAWAGPQQTLYAAHGALMIFTRAYFQRGGTLDYPCFLFGEEVWAAEELRLRGLHTIYDPQIKVLDDDHVSTRRLSKGALAGLHASSMRFLRRTYFDGPHPGYPST
jgi:GT2 family glycosyltransferase